MTKFPRGFYVVSEKRTTLMAVYVQTRVGLYKMMLMPAVENIMDSWSPIEPEQVIETLEEEGI